MKIVIDTNTLVNASADDYNYGHRIIEEVLTGKIEAFANSQTLRENRLIVNRKVTDESYKNLLYQFFDHVQIVESQHINVVEDPEDNKILGSAVAAEVDYLVTSDWHLLKLQKYNEVKIVSPQGFWADYESDSGQSWQKWVDSFIRE